MDLDTLKARTLAAREISHPIGELVYRLRLPTQHDVLLAARRSGATGAAADGTGLLILQRTLIEAALIGWQGLRVGHLLPDDPEAASPLAWEPGAVALLLDARPGDAQALADALSEQMATRKQAREADAKN
jgi:hypothetical protein